MASAAELAAASAAAASLVAVESAAISVAEGRPSADFALPAAKIRAGEAAGAVAEIAHQVHGAIGFTEEYDLHRVTIPLMRWRGAYGNDAYWAARLGRQVAGFGGRGLWEAMTARG
jgi:alkylation response protein AidB-like acyl-CoA dehydrogenase